MLSVATHRPRNVDSPRAAAILYGDLGTSKAYVIGLAFALAGYSSFWLIAAVSILTLLIGINYIIICKYYPNGGGVYASVRHRSQIISMIGAFFLIADYLVTAALSALSAFSYIGVSDPILFSCIFIGFIGILNFFGPRHTGSLAFVIGICAFFVLTILAIFSIPHLPMAWHNIQPLKGDSWTIWKHFVGVIVALSGIEAIANTTGIMKLNRGSTETRPLVTKTSTKAIVSVILEVAIYTSLFGFVAAAINNFEISNDTVNAPGNPNVRDYMLRYLGETFVGNILGTQIGHAFGIILSYVIGILLLSAVNTAINGLIALQYLMSSDGEVPSYFQKLNRQGVPLVPLLIATLIPIVLVATVRDVAGLASLYAIGFVGAIATNLGSTSTDFTLDLKKTERGLMFFSFLIMAAIELTLFITKPDARMYGLTVILVGLVIRGLSREFKEKRIERMQRRAMPFPIPFPLNIRSLPVTPVSFSILCAVKKSGKALDAALEKTNKHNCNLHLLFIREQEVISETDMNKTWETDEEAKALFSYSQSRIKNELLHFHYVISDSPPDIIVAYAEQFSVKQVLIEKDRLFTKIFKGNIASSIQRNLPEEIQLSVVS